MTTVLRPAFFEGQILAATDLGAAVDHPRGRAARHDRYLHEWGIAEGLTLAKEERTDPQTNQPYVEVTLKPGVAVDGTGREVVVPEPVVLQESLFDEVNGADPDTADPYPVFLAGLDEQKTTTSFTADRCGAAQQATRVDESYQIIFGKLGEQRRTHEPPTVTDGPGDGTDPWPILVGYVIWDGRHFVDITDHDPQGVAPPRTGVRAAVVAAPAGRLTMRTRPVAEAGSVIRLDDETGLAFGRAGAAGDMTDLFAVSPNGDLTVRGTLTAGPRRGDVVVDSGLVNDGMLLPLPTGVDAARVADKSVVLHVWLRPHPSESPPPASESWIDSIVECAIDEQRRVHCTVRSIRVDPDHFERKEGPATAEYLVLAVTAEPGGK